MKETMLKFANLAKNWGVLRVQHAYKFLQTPLGSAIASGAILSTGTYLFSYTTLSRERDIAVEKFEKEHELNVELKKSNTLLLTALEELSRENSTLHKEKMSLSNKYIKRKSSFHRCIDQLDAIKSLHNNAWFFKPNVNDLGNGFRKKLDELDETSSSTKLGFEK